MSQGRVAGSRTEFVDGWKEWAREINRLAYQSENSGTIMVAIELRIELLALIDEIAGEIYPAGDLPYDYDMTSFTPIEWVEANDDQSTD
jgi:hypothetical protein